MAMTFESHDSLPYIDPQISEADKVNANKLIAAQLPKNHASVPHPSLPLMPESNFSELMSKEIQRVASKKPLSGGVDLSRYEPPDEPSDNGDSDAWRKALRSAYTSSTYLSGRQVNLSLLEELGKNAWLIGNSQLDQTLKTLEGELERLKTETDNVNKARKAAQEGSKGELHALSETWKSGIGRLIEVQISTNALRNEILEHRRARAR